MKINYNSGISFDDLLLIPQKSLLNSRSDVNISTTLKNNNNSHELFLRIPIISSNMDTITGLNMAVAMSKVGGLGILHRFMSIEDNIYILNKSLSTTEPLESVGISVGITDYEIERAIKMEYTFRKHNRKAVICVDVAHAHSQKCIDAIKKIKSYYEREYPNMYFIIAGNVATHDGAKSLWRAGADCIKVGIGSGSVCSTRVVTGHGLPLAQSIINIRAKSLFPIIADGGIRSSGDIVKAIGLGANAVMIGRLLAGTSAAETKNKEGTSHIYRGNSTFEVSGWNQKSRIGINAIDEGISTEVEYSGPTENIIYKLCAGIKRGLSYSGASSIADLQKKAKFTKITHSSYIEGLPKYKNEQII
jgi:IMP dehydrogenase